MSAAVGCSAPSSAREARRPRATSCSADMPNSARALDVATKGMTTVQFCASARAESVATARQPYLTAKFQVGSSKSRLNASREENVFHSNDPSPHVVEAKRNVIKSLTPNILDTEQREWNASTIADQKIQKDSTHDLKRQLLKVRAGFMDEYEQKPSKHHSDQKLHEMQAHVVRMSGSSRHLTGRQKNLIDERGLAKHSFREDWPDWNESWSTKKKEDVQHAQAIFEQKEEQRKNKAVSFSSPSPNAFASASRPARVGASESIANANHGLRERKVEWQSLKEQFKVELRLEFPDASEERLQSMAQRLLNEKAMADAKMARFPPDQASFKPQLSLTSPDRRYRLYHHPGKWGWSEREKRNCWSCCLNFTEDSRGCEYRVCNPDAWCYGFLGLRTVVDARRH